MNVPQFRFDVIARNRRVYLSTPDGRAALRDALQSYGFTAGQAKWHEMLADPGPNLRLLLEGFLLLQDLGVLIEDNFDRLIQKMAELPMPELE